MRARPECFHQSAQTIPGGPTFCTDHCSRIFPSRDAWIVAIREAAEAVIARVSVGGICDKEAAVTP